MYNCNQTLYSPKIVSTIIYTLIAGIVVSIAEDYHLRFMDILFHINKKNDRNLRCLISYSAYVKKILPVYKIRAFGFLEKFLRGCLYVKA